MNKLEKLFTIADIAEMTSLFRPQHPQLSAQWTADRPEGRRSVTFHLAGYHELLPPERRQSIGDQAMEAGYTDFIDSVNLASEGERQACTVVDLYLSREEADACNEKVSDYFSACPPSFRCGSRPLRVFGKGTPRAIHALSTPVHRRRCAEPAEIIASIKQRLPLRRSGRRCFIPFIFSDSLPFCMQRPQKEGLSKASSNHMAFSHLLLQGIRFSRLFLSRFSSILTFSRISKQ